MFQRPSSALGGANGSSAILVPSTGNNENLIFRSQKSTGGNENEPSKTPGGNGTTIRRRALGDISNKKKGGISGKGLAPHSTNKTVLNPRGASNIVWQPSSSTGAESTFPRKTGNQLSRIPGGGATMGVAARVPETMIPRISPHPATGTGGNLKGGHRSVTFLEQKQKSSLQKSSDIIPKSSLKPKRPVLATLSSNTNIPKAAPKPNSNSAPTKHAPFIKKYKFQIEDPVPDIELPAGRTWKQQLEYDLKEEDDIASTSSLDDILLEKLDARSMWDDWKESMWKQQKQEDEELDRFAQAELNAVLERDQRDYEQGIDGLCDTVSGLTFFDSDSEIDLEIKDDSFDNDEWSLPASSLCGPEAEDSFFKL